jgi:methylmalonyl-CoA mutase cobalamin-binding subunit
MIGHAADGDAIGHAPHGDTGVAPFAAQVISLLCERQTVTSAGVRQIALDYLSRTLLARDGFDAARVLDELRGYRLTLDSVIDLYIPQAAVQLGDMWMGSDIDFAEVTVGALRLQSLLGEASNGLVRIGPLAKDALHALIVVPAGEQHFLGACVVAAQLRRNGCEASLSICEEPKQIVARVVSDRPDMVFLSCARMAAIEGITKTVKKIRSSVEHAPVLALGGPLRGNADGIREQTGVDIVTNVAVDVVSFCAKRKKALGRQ